MHKRLWFLLLGIGLFLGSCTLAPKYTRPEVPVPAQWPQGDAYQNTLAKPGAPTIPALKWEDFLADKPLQKIIAIALNHNRDLRLTALNVERARALYGIQRAELLPAVNALGAGGKQRRSADLIGPGDPRTIAQYSANLGIVAWEIDFFGRIRSLKDQALQAYSVHGTGPSQRTDRAGIRACQGLHDPGRRQGKPQAGPVHP